MNINVYCENASDRDVDVIGFPSGSLSARGQGSLHLGRAAVLSLKPGLCGGGEGERCTSHSSHV